MQLTTSGVCLVLLSGLSFEACSEIDFYGKANVSVQSSDDGEGSFTEIKSNASRLGLKGTHSVYDGLKAVYKFEFQVNISDGGDKDNISARNQYVGLKGGFGQVVLGRNDTALKQSQGKVELFNDLKGDLKSTFKGENRLGDTITYTSNAYADFKLLATFVAQDNKDDKNGYSVALTYGDKALKKGNVYAAIAADSEINGYDVVRATLHAKIVDFSMGAMYQTQEKVDGSARANGYLVNAAHVVGRNTFKVQYQIMDFDDSDDKTAVSVGIDHKLSDNIKIFGFYSSFDMDSEVDQRYLGVGIDYKF